ncbi:hypothetical protein, partial [Rahnella sp. NRRL B-41462]|uniref:hypothetical protein n=1 Tax=Rahnella sp. NRRL B-41462 TaxID=1610579 RepID=UPI001E319FC7
KAATPNFTFFTNRSLIRQFRPKWTNTGRFSLKTHQFQARGWSKLSFIIKRKTFRNTLHAT